VHWSAACRYSLSKALGKDQQSVLNFQLFLDGKRKTDWKFILNID
jgi:hypothetical protein